MSELLAEADEAQARRTALIEELAETRKKRGISQMELEKMSGVKQPVIARMETGATTPNLSTVLKLLVPFGKTLYIGDLNRDDQPSL